MTRFEIFKEKLKICWKLWRANQYFFASYRGDMSVGVQILGKKNLSCFNSDPTYPIFIETCEKMCRQLAEESNEQWESVGEQIPSYDDLFTLLNYGIYCYVSLPDDFQDSSKRWVVKGNGETKHIEVWESRADGKLLWEYNSGDEMKEKLWEPQTASGRIFYFLRYESKEQSADDIIEDNFPV